MHVLCVILCMLMLDEAVPFKPLRYSVLVSCSRVPTVLDVFCLKVVHGQA